MNNDARVLIDLLSKPDDSKPLRPDQLRYASIEGVESLFGCQHMALRLFSLINEHHGETEARRIFAMWGTLPTPTRMRQIRNEGLLTRYDMMKPKPNVQRLAREVAEENRSLPQKDRKGAGGTTVHALDRLIRRLVRERKKRREVARRRLPTHSAIANV
jgi:hypothetical protein